MLFVLHALVGLFIFRYIFVVDDVSTTRHLGPFFACVREHVTSKDLDVKADFLGLKSYGRQLALLFVLTLVCISGQFSPTSN